jgi:D-glycero-D-manno-heptose 1,7-bisphosphate phosphatase
MGYNPPVRRAVFLDRDGTIIEEKEYLADPARVVVFPGAGAALRRLQDAGFLLVVVTNQSGIGRGYYTLADAEAVNARMLELLASHGVQIERIYLAPESPDQPSRGRKPSPQFLFDARDEFRLDLAASYMVGDKLLDLECGWNAGLRRSLLVRTGYGAEWERKIAGQSLPPWAACDDLPAAVQWILTDANSSRAAAGGSPGES